MCISSPALLSFSRTHTLPLTLYREMNAGILGLLYFVGSCEIWYVQTTHTQEHTKQTKNKNQTNQTRECASVPVNSSIGEPSSFAATVLTASSMLFGRPWEIHICEFSRLGSRQYSSVAWVLFAFGYHAFGLFLVSRCDKGFTKS